MTELKAEFAWLPCLPGMRSQSWFISTVGDESLEVVRRHVGNQKEVV